MVSWCQCVKELFPPPFICKGTKNFPYINTYLVKRLPNVLTYMLNNVNTYRQVVYCCPLGSWLGARFSRPMPLPSVLLSLLPVRRWSGSAILIPRPKRPRARAIGHPSLSRSAIENSVARAVASGSLRLRSRPLASVAPARAVGRGSASLRRRLPLRDALLPGLRLLRCALRFSSAPPSLSGAGSFVPPAR